MKVAWTLLILGALMVVVAVNTYDSSTLYLEKGTYEVLMDPSNVQISPADLCISGVRLELEEVPLSPRIRPGNERYLLMAQGRGELTISMENDSKSFRLVDGGYIPLPVGDREYYISSKNLSLKLFRVVNMSNYRVRTEIDGSNVILPEGDYVAVISGEGPVTIKKLNPNVPLLLAGLALIVAAFLRVIKGANTGRGEESG